METPHRASVTGTGCICAAGNNTADALASMLLGERHPLPPQRTPTDLDPPRPVFEIKSDLESETARALDLLESEHPPPASRTARLALLATLQALGEADLKPRDLAPLRVGVCLGTTVGCTLDNEPFYRDWKSGKTPDGGPLRNYLANNTAQWVARVLGATGPVATIANACSSGTDAIGLAAHWIREGRCDIAIAGGADALSRVTCLGFASLMNTSDEPCRPFDRDRKGLNLGEGAGVLVLERPGGRKRKPLAWVAGYGCAADAHHPTAPHPDGRGLRQAVLAALEEAALQPNAIGFVNAHGTATPDNDRVESAVLGELLGHGPSVVATKGYTGHTLGAAGGIEAALTVQHLNSDQLPGIAGFQEAESGCTLTLSATPQERSGKAALSTSLAFGGTNSALVLAKEQQR